MNEQIGMNRYERFVGGSLELDRLGGLPVRRGEFLGLPVRDNGVDVVQAAVHPVNLKFHSEFGHTVSLKGFVLLVIEVNAGELSSLIGAGDLSLIHI